MKGLLLIFKREFLAYFRTPMGIVILASVLVADGILFNAFAMGRGETLSAEVLQRFFEYSSGIMMIASILLAMRLLAEERQSGTIALVFAAPIPDYQMVTGKFLSAFAFLTVMTALTIYMPALIFVNGKVSVGHIAAGYLGLLLLGAASLSIGLFGSALARSQVVAAITGALILVSLLLLWLLSRVTDPPFDGVLAYLALWDKHYRPFMKGIVSTRDVIYYLSVTVFFLLASTRVVESRRWS